MAADPMNAKSIAIDKASKPIIIFYPTFAPIYQAENQQAFGV